MVLHNCARHISVTKETMCYVVWEGCIVLRIDYIKDLDVVCCQ